jgi:hypothetical protein
MRNGFVGVGAALLVACALAGCGECEEDGDSVSCDYRNCEELEASECSRDGCALEKRCEPLRDCLGSPCNGLCVERSYCVSD